jgi:membrane protease YdiL (CAAX protease family)
VDSRHSSPLRLGIIFTVYAFAVSWLCWLPVVALDHQVGHVPPAAAPLLIILGTFGPFLAATAIVTRASGFRGLREYVSQAFRWRVGLQWYAAALVLPAAIRLGVISLHILKGGGFPWFSSPEPWLAIPSTFLFVLLIGGPTGEEFGWRGFLLQRVQPVFGLFGAALVIGVISAFWHLPLFLMPGTAQSHLPFLLFGARTIALSVVSTWLYNGSQRSLLMVLLFHASLNTWPNTLYLLEVDNTLGPYTASTIIYAGWAVQLLIFGLLRGHGDRREADTVQSAAA